MNADHQTAHLPGTRLRVWGIFAAFAGGLALAPHLPAPDARLWWALAGAAGLATAAVARTRAWMLPILLSCVLMGIAWHSRTFIQAPSERFGASVPLGPDGTGLVQVRGIVVQPPRPPRPLPGALARFAIQSPATRFDVAVEAMNVGDAWLPTQGKAWVRVRGTSPDLPLEPGSRVELLGRFEPIGPVTNPGAFDLQAYAFDRGYCGSIALSDWSLVQRLPESTLALERLHAAATRFIEQARVRAHEIVRNAAGDDPASRALLLGLLLGEFDESQRETFDAFTRQSLVHVLSISGFHLSVMAGLALVLIRLTGERGWIEPAAVALLVVFYALLVPPQSPIVRSAALTLAMIAGELVSRRYDRLTLLGWVALGVIIWHPSELFSLGCQLSVGLTAALLSLTEPVRDALFVPRLKGTLRDREHRLSDRMLEGIKTAVAANVTCWWVALPVLMARAGVVVPGSEAAASRVLEFLSEWTIWMVHRIEALPLSSIRVPPIPLAWTFAATIAAVLIARFGLTGSYPAHRRGWSLAGVAACVTWLCGAWAFSPLRDDVLLRIDMLDVGDGTCHLVRSGDQALLWDCGTLGAAGQRSDIVSAVRALGTGRVPTAIVTHPDLDHFGALPDLIGPLGIERVLVSPRFVEEMKNRPQSAAAEAGRQLESRGVEIVTVNAGDRLTLGDSELQFKSPSPDAPFEKDNDHSLVAQITAPSFGPRPMLLLTGDVEDAAIRMLRDRGEVQSPCVLELPHHGSARTEAIDWVGQSLRPDLILQSTGIRRARDGRWDGVRHGREWLCTALHGAAWVEFRAGGRVTHGSLLADDTPD